MRKLIAWFIIGTICGGVVGVLVWALLELRFFLLESVSVALSLALVIYAFAWAWMELEKKVNV